MDGTEDSGAADEGHASGACEAADGASAATAADARLAAAVNELDPQQRVRGKVSMAKLDAAERKQIPASEYGLPGKRKYPMPDKEHAKDAKGRATQMVKRGKLSPSSAAKIRAKADRILGE